MNRMSMDLSVTDRSGTELHSTKFLQGEAGHEFARTFPALLWAVVSRLLLIACWVQAVTAEASGTDVIPVYSLLLLDSGSAEIVEFAAGGDHSCARLTDGHVQCWGFNNHGQLGNDSTSQSEVPVYVQGISTAIAISAGQTHSCALLDDGKVNCWGLNENGQLGNDSDEESPVPVVVQGINSVVSIGAGGSHSCASLSSGQVQCWGLNENGQLGNNSDTESWVPVKVQGITSATTVSAGGLHSCASLANGRVRCWGINDDGQLGNNDIAQSEVPVDVEGITTATTVSAGGFHSCARLSDSRIKCWGLNDDGQLGNNSTDQSGVPVDVQIISTAVEISAGTFHSCARLVSSVLRSSKTLCWGANDKGQIGNDGPSGFYKTPQEVSGIITATAMAAGGTHSCATLANGEIECWGNNGNGQLGDNSTDLSGAPVKVAGFNSFTSIGAGGSHSCAMQSDRTIRCWGNNSHGQLGNSSITSEFKTAVDVQGISSATAVSTGGTHSCALMKGGSVRCWGNNGNGQLGDDSFSPSNTPVNVDGISNATAISTGTAHSCARLETGEVQCWGSNGSGQLGNDGGLVSFDKPEDVVGISNATAISAGTLHSCARLGTGGVQCWGSNSSGQLGNNSNTLSKVPVNVQGISTATGISSGGSHSCARLSNGGLQCWGSNNNGQLGNNSITTEFKVPVDVVGINNATLVSTGEFHSCARLTDGQVRCWGRNSSDQLGNDSSITESRVPVNVVDISNATTVSNGQFHSCVRLEDGRGKCWGDNGVGQLGNDSNADSGVPVIVY